MEAKWTLSFFCSGVGMRFYCESSGSCLEGGVGRLRGVPACGEGIAGWNEMFAREKS